MDTIDLEYTDVFEDNKIKRLSFSSFLIKEEYKIASLFALQVDGHSMEPVINHKALVIADLSNKTLIDEKIYIVYHDNKMWIKKYIKSDDSFISINPKYSHLVYKVQDVHLVARVLLTFTNL